MTTEEIQRRIDAICTGMTAKALPLAAADFRLRAHTRPSVGLTWSSNGRSHYGDKYEYFNGSIEKVLADAEAFVAALPSPEQARVSQFMAALSEAIELGKKADIEVEYVNPLMALMKKLSKNALQHQPAE